MICRSKGKELTPTSSPVKTHTVILIRLKKRLSLKTRMLPKMRPRQRSLTYEGQAIGLKESDRCTQFHIHPFTQNMLNSKFNCKECGDQDLWHLLCYTGFESPIWECQNKADFKGGAWRRRGTLHSIQQGLATSAPHEHHEWSGQGEDYKEAFTVRPENFPIAPNTLHSELHKVSCPICRRM